MSCSSSTQILPHVVLRAIATAELGMAIGAPRRLASPFPWNASRRALDPDLFSRLAAQVTSPFVPRTSGLIYYAIVVLDWWQ